MNEAPKKPTQTEHCTKIHKSTERHTYKIWTGRSTDTHRKYKCGDCGEIWYEEKTNRFFTESLPKKWTDNKSSND